MARASAFQAEGREFESRFPLHIRYIAFMIKKLENYTLFKNQKIVIFTKLKNQGYCNINYLLETQNQKYLIRDFRIKNDRELEYKSQNLAYKKNIAPKPILLDIKNSLMITEFIDGNHKTKLNRRELRELALTIKRVHKINIRQKPTSLKSHFNFKSKKAHLSFIKLKKYKKDLVLCHNDLHPQNILFSKKIKLIDWEYSSVNDRYLDLASILTEFKFNSQYVNYFLKIYFGQKERVEVDKLLCYKVIYRELSKVWFKKLNRYN